MLHTGSQSKGHTLGFAAVVAQVLVVDPHPEGLQKVGLGPCKSVAIT